MTVYADTGFLISLYLNETTSETANDTVKTLTAPLPLVPLPLLEMRNAFHRTEKGLR